MALFAQTATGFEGWLPLMGQLGTGAVLAWFLWYTVSVAGPAKDKEHAETIRQINKEFNETLERVVNKFDVALSAERQAREADREKWQAWCRNLGPPRE